MPQEPAFKDSLGLAASASVYESRDVCLFSPNMLFQCGTGDSIGASISYQTTGGLRRCEQTFQQVAKPHFDVQVISFSRTAVSKTGARGVVHM